MDIKKVKWAKKNKYQLRAVTPDDFKECGIPFGLFTLKEEYKTVWQQHAENDKTDEELIKQVEQQKEVILKVLQKGIVKKPWYIKLDRLVNEDHAQSLFLYSSIISISVDIDNVVAIDKKFAEVIDMTASRYHCRPSDIMLPNSNDLEKAVYDVTICSVGMKKDLNFLNKKIANAKKRRAKKGK